jgi:hypothetical protein
MNLSTILKPHRLVTILCCICLGCILLACTPSESSDSRTDPTIPPTPATEMLRVSGISASGGRLVVTLPSITLLNYESGTDVQLFAIMADTNGTYAYLLYPANQPGTITDQFILTQFPLELSINDHTEAVALWLLAVHNTRYRAAESFGLDALASSLAIGFRNWLVEGSTQDDPLAAVVSASEGALFEWFAEIDVLGQAMTTFMADDNWNVGLSTLHSPDGGLSAVYTVQYASEVDVAQLIPSPTPALISEDRPGYTLRVDDTFANANSTHQWYQGRDETYVNYLTNGAYEIRLTDIVQRSYGLSWGSIEHEHFENYVIEAQVRLVEDNVTDGRYGIWFNYQDDYNFIYFGISNRGEYRVAVIQSNSKRREIQDWTPSPAILTGAATNILSIESGDNGSFALSVNGERLMTFRDQTFEGGSVAFFCYAESVPTTCRLERLRVWERTD